MENSIQGSKCWGSLSFAPLPVVTPSVFNLSTLRCVVLSSSFIRSPQPNLTLFLPFYSPLPLVLMYIYGAILKPLEELIWNPPARNISVNVHKFCYECTFFSHFTFLGRDESICSISMYLQIFRSKVFIPLSWPYHLVFISPPLWLSGLCPSAWWDGRVVKRHDTFNVRSERPNHSHRSHSQKEKKMRKW